MIITIRTTNGSFRTIAVIISILATAENAMAGSLLRRDSAASGSASTSPDAVAVTAQNVAVQAAAARQAQSALRRALDAIRQFQAGQDAARTAAGAVPSDVPNGLDGLVVAPGLDAATLRKETQCAPGSLWCGASAPTSATTQDGRTQVTVEQGQQKAILTWQTFNVGRETDVHFDQRAGGADANQWVALNRVLDPSGKPSQILGSIKAEGQVYLINRNGIIFGGSSQVNVSTLIASSLELVPPTGSTSPDQRFLNGLLATTTGDTFSGVGGAVAVDPGAKIAIGNSGQALLLGSTVANGGWIESPDGQVLLAAAEGVSLNKRADQRGYELPAVSGGGVVENTGIVSTPRGNISMAGSEVRQDGLLTATTSGEANGSIVIGRSDAPVPKITLGNGSITQILPDEDSKNVIGATKLNLDSQVQVYGERITLLDGSTIYVPAGDVILSANLSPAQIAARTADEVNGPPDDTRVYIGEGARVDVSGLQDVEVPMEQNNVKGELRADELRDNPVLRDGPLRSCTVFFDGRLGGKLMDGSGIADLSGYYGLIERKVDQLMTAGGSVILKGNEIIARQGSVIDISGGNLRYLDGYVRSTLLIDQTGRRVSIEDATAGTRYVGIDGDFVVAHPRWGITETYSSPLFRSRPRFERGYLEGASAGTLTVDTVDSTSVTTDDQHKTNLSPQTDNPSATGAFRIFDGEIRAGTVIGPKQRELASTDPNRAQQQRDDPSQSWRLRPGGATLDIERSGDVTIVPGGSAGQLGADLGPDTPFGASDQRKYRLVLPDSWFDGSTFGKVVINSGFWDQDPTLGDRYELSQSNWAPGGHLAIGAGVVVDLGDGGSFSFTGKRADIEGTLRASGGSVSLTTLDLAQTTDPSHPLTWETITADQQPTTHVGATGLIDVAGRLSNDHLDNGVPLRALDGGSVALTASSVILDSGSLIDVGGGARLDATGAQLTSGKGGKIAIDVSQPAHPGAPRRQFYDGRLDLNGRMSGYALETGGALQLNTPYQIVISDELPAGGGATYHLSPEDHRLDLGRLFFTQGGFSSYSVTGERGVTVTAGTVLAPTVETLVLPDRAAEIPGGTRLIDVAATQVLPEPLRGPMTLSLSTVHAGTYPDVAGVPGFMDLIVENGASIEMSPGSTVNLSASGTAFVDGIVDARGGGITISGIDKGSTANPLGPARVFLGPHARLLAPGYERSTPEDALLRRSVEAGGTIALSANEMLIDSQAVIDVSGVVGISDLTSAPGARLGQSRYQAQQVAGSAGAVSITAHDGVLAGTFELAPGGPGAAGGSLAISWFGSSRWGSGGAPVISQGAPSGFGSVLYETPEDSLPAEQNMRGDYRDLTVVAKSVDASGADSFSLTTSGAILFDGDVSLQTRRSLSLVSPVIGTTLGGPASVTLQSGYVQLDGASKNQTDLAGSHGAGLHGELNVVADLIDLNGAVALGCNSSGDSCTAGGFSTARFVASGDIRLSDHDLSGTKSVAAGLFSDGALELESAQVYVTSRLQDVTSAGLERADSDPGFLVRSDTRITVKGNGQPAPVPRSFGERITLRAPEIVQGGVVRAPQGQIRLEGTAGPNGEPGSVTLLPGSLTSASLEGLTVPFGPVLTGGTFVGYDQPGQAPTKSVKLDAASVAVQQGAVIDVSGGGGLLGYTFVPGAGGSNDILSAADTYAVLPGVAGTGPAPVGGVGTLQSSSLKVGDSIWLQGVPGLADGYYSLLPAHYALLPGGFLVRSKNLEVPFASAQATYSLPDGSVVASGRRVFDLGPQQDGAARSYGTYGPGWGRYLVMPGDVIEKHSQLDTYSFADTARSLMVDTGITVRTPADAGTITLLAQNLTLKGTGRFDANGGLLGNLDISASKIAVLGSDQLPPDQDCLVLRPDELTHFGAGSVLLGGTRAPSTDPSLPGTAVTVSAQEVKVDTRNETAWTGPEIILAATGSVSIADGSEIRAEGATSGSESPLVLTGNGTMLRLSTSGRVGLVRSSGNGNGGVLDVGNSTLSASGSMSLDASQSVLLASGVVLSAPQLDLASNRVNLGDVPQAQPVPGTTLGKELVTRLAASSDLLIRGYDAIQLYGDLTLGSGSGAAALPGITLDTGLLQGHADGATTQLTAGVLTLRNSGPAYAGTVASGKGTLAIDVSTLVLGPGDVQVGGYRKLTGRASAVEGQGDSSLTFAGDVSLATGQVRAASGADSRLTAVGGSVALTGASSAAEVLVDTLGGRFAVVGSSVAIDTQVTFPAGTFAATATDGALSLGENAKIDVSGRAVDFRDQVRFAPGGTIRLSATGDLAVAGGASLDVSGSTRGGDAGRLDLVAGGAVALEGDLRGSAVGYQGGAFALDAASLSNLSALNAKLEAGAFNASREIRLRGESMDLRLGVGETITAHEVVLRADAGRVDIAGTIAAAGDAAHPDGGRIELVGGNGVQIDGTLDAHSYAGDLPANAFLPASAEVEIAAAGGAVDVAAGAIIDISGGRGGGGSLVVRAPRKVNDVAVELAGTVKGARWVTIQGVKDYQTDETGAVDGLVTTMLGEAADWLQTSRNGIESRLSSSSTLTNLEVGAGMVVKSDGDMTLGTDIDLHTLAGPGYLALDAGKGNIVLDAAVSDGFDKADRATATLMNGRSASYSLEAGGDITLTAKGMLRTGTGDISIQAGRDLKLESSSSVIYTAGKQTGWEAQFTGAPSGMPIGYFPTDGGDIDIRAGGDITAPSTSQTTSAWLFRYGKAQWNGTASTSTVLQQTSWSILYKNFEQGVGALGGGDVRVRAGNDIDQLQVAIPTTGQLTTPAGMVAQEGDLVVRGGGDLELSAGRDILGGLFVLGLGHADLRAGRSVSASDDVLSLRNSAGSSVTQSNPSRRAGIAALFGLMDATASVTAASAIDIEGAFDPMRQGQIGENLQAGTGGSAFWGYSDRTALEAISLNGDVKYDNDPWASVDVADPFNQSRSAYQVSMSGVADTSLNMMFARTPPTLRLASLGSSVLLTGPFISGTLTMGPSARGTLDLLAREDVRFGLSNLKVEEIAPEYGRGPLDPFSTISNTTVDLTAWSSNTTNNALKGSVPIHAGDPDPLRVYALNGSVCAYQSGSCLPSGARPAVTSFSLPKPIEVFAGKDVRAGNYQPQNNDPSNLSSIEAGRDIYDVTFQVRGEGAALMKAGRDLVQHLVASSSGTTSATSTLGGLVYDKGDGSNGVDQVNPALPHREAADLTIMAGAAGGTDYDAFRDAYLDPSNSHGVVRTYLPELADYMKGLDPARYGSLSNVEFLNAFKALPPARQEIFLDRVYFAELKATGLDYNDPQSVRYRSYDRGYRAVSLLFPATPSAQGGNVILDGKPLETWAHGDITVLAPHGRVAVGSERLDTSSAGGGIVTRRGGDIRIMADQSIDLFTSRVFTLQGGDITMWTSKGSITAGSGSKTSVSDVPLSYMMSNDAVVTVNAFGLQTGAGIGVLDALQGGEDLPRSRLDLVAPKGEVNAGDAGIRVVGDLNLAAALVVGMENIQVSGSSAGVPQVVVPNVNAITAASSVTQAAAREGMGPETQAARNPVTDLPSIITVEVVGYETTDKAAGQGEQKSDEDGRRKKKR